MASPVEEIRSCLSEYEIHILKTPQDTRYRMHPVFRRGIGEESTCVEFRPPSEYEINQAYHDHVDRRLSPKALQAKLKLQETLWRETEERIVRNTPIDVTRHSAGVYLSQCATTSMRDMFLAKYIDELESLKSRKSTKTRPSVECGSSHCGAVDLGFQNQI